MLEFAGQGSLLKVLKQVGTLDESLVQSYIKQVNFIVLQCERFSPRAVGLSSIILLPLSEKVFRTLAGGPHEVESKRFGMR